MTKMRNLLAALVVLTSLGALSTAPAHAYVCKAYPVSQDGAHVLKVRAKAKARSKWPAKAKALYGLPWSVWKIAKDKKVTCKKVGSVWSCKAKAKPCKYVVF
jgi:hypothetical protein